MSTTNNEMKFGWVPDLPDNRDFFYAAPMDVVRALPSSIDLRNICPEIVDQGQLGSCTSNAAGAAFQLQQTKQGIPDFPASRLFIYYNTREVQGTLGYDSGASIRETIKTMNTLGICAEERWPYVISDFTKRPTDECYEKALTNQILQYNSIDSTRSPN
jgi:C1A family cysteine protease